MDKKSRRNHEKHEITRSRTGSLAARLFSPTARSARRETSPAARAGLQSSCAFFRVTSCFSWFLLLFSLRPSVLGPPVAVADRLGDGAVDPAERGIGRALLELEDVPLAVEQDHR